MSQSQTRSVYIPLLSPTPLRLPQGKSLSLSPAPRYRQGHNADTRAPRIREQTLSACTKSSRPIARVEKGRNPRECVIFRIGETLRRNRYCAWVFADESNLLFRKGPNLFQPHQPKANSPRTWFYSHRPSSLVLRRQTISYRRTLNVGIRYVAWQKSELSSAALIARLRDLICP
jgi:hypothetical protein